MSETTTTAAGAVLYASPRAMKDAADVFVATIGPFGRSYLRTNLQHIIPASDALYAIKQALDDRAAEVLPSRLTA